MFSRPLATCWLRPKDSYGNVTVRSKIMKHLSGLPGVSTSATSNSWLLLEDDLQKMMCRFHGGRNGRICSKVNFC